MAQFRSINRWMVHIPIYAIGLGTFSIVNVPSLKLVFGSTSLVNIAAFGLLLFGAITQVAHANKIPSKMYSTSTDGLAITAISIAFFIIVIPELFGLRSPHPNYLTDTLSLIYTAAALAVISIIARYRDLRIYLGAQVTWAALLSFLYLANIVDYSRELGQHYNTLGVPITLGLIVLVGYAIAPNNSLSREHMASMAIIGAVMFAGILSLHGRSPFIGLVLSIGVGMFLMVRRLPGNQIRQSGQLAAVIISVGIVGGAIMRATSLVDSLVIDLTIQMITNPTNESRIATYADTVAFIISNPFGYGLGAFEPMYGSPYPHNLLLHATFAGGWIAGILFTGGFLLLVLLAYLLFEFNPTAVSLSMVMAVTYLLFTFMVSYSITHSYQLFALLALASAARTCRKS